MLSNSEEHAVKENDIKTNNYYWIMKALKQVENYKKIVSLKKDTYDKTTISLKKMFYHLINY